MAMQRKTITLTDQMDSWVKNQVNSGKYGNDSEYLRELIRRDQQRQEAESRLRSLLDQAEVNGLSDFTPLEIWAKAEKLFAEQS